MKKSVPIFLAGVLFVVTFLGLIGITHITGLWVQREGRPGGYEAMEGGQPAGGFNGTEGSQDESMTKYANMTVIEFCQDNKIDTECAMSKLGIDSSKLESTLDTVAKEKGTTLAQMIKLVEECNNGSSSQENSPGEGGGDL